MMSSGTTVRCAPSKANAAEALGAWVRPDETAVAAAAAATLALYSKLPRAVWTSVHVPQVHYGDGESPYEVSHVHARAVYAVR